MLPSSLPLQQVNTGGPSLVKGFSPWDLGLQIPQTSSCSKHKRHSRKALCSCFGERGGLGDTGAVAGPNLTSSLLLLLSLPFKFHAPFPCSCWLPVSWHTLSNSYLNSLKYLHCSLWYNENSIQAGVRHFPQSRAGDLPAVTPLLVGSMPTRLPLYTVQSRAGPHTRHPVRKTPCPGPCHASNSAPKTHPDTICFKG